MTDYSKKGHYYIQEPRFELTYLLPLLRSQSHVLDMGAGNGNNTKLLLENGHTVTAVEPNPQEIKTLKLLQKDYPKRLRVVEASIDTYVPDRKYDAVICLMVIHFMKDRGSGIKAVEDIQSWTKPNGFNLVTCYMDGQSLPSDFSFLVKPDELAGLYKEWGIPWRQESFRLTIGRIYSLADIPKLLLRKRGFKAARLIARKPAK